MAQLHAHFNLGRCPHCRIDNPNLEQQAGFQTNDQSRCAPRFWKAYACSRCGGVVIAAAREDAGPAIEWYPQASAVEDVLPETPKAYLQQTIDSVHAPAGAVMLAASAIDAMLKAKGYSEGSLYKRIDKAAENHLITEGMAKWAHEVRLDANDQRHADDHIQLPTSADAKRAIDFASALGQFLFVLPSRVQRGIQEAESAT